MRAISCHNIKEQARFFYTFAVKKKITTLYPMQLFLVRHGETEENVQQILQGQMPGHLTTNGRKQAANLAQQLATHYAPFHVMLVSDLQRTRDTAAILNKVLHIPHPILCPLLRERDWGSFTGKDIAYARTHNIPEDAESVDQLFERAKKFLLYVNNTFPNKRVLAVGHGLFNRTLQAALQGCAIRDIPRMQNAEIRELKLPTSHTEKNSTLPKDDEVSAN